MEKPEKRTWVIRAGKMSEAQDLFFQENVIALFEPGMGDLSLLKPIRHDFYDAYRSCDPKATNTGISGIGGKYFRFVHEIQNKDMVLFPSRKDYHVYVGTVTSKYIYAPEIDSRFPHQRKVKWKLSFKKSDLSTFAFRELGAARTFFEFKRNVSELNELIENGTAKPINSIPV